MILVRTVVVKEAMKLFPSYQKEEIVNFAIMPGCFVAENENVESKPK